MISVTQDPVRGGVLLEAVRRQHGHNRARRPARSPKSPAQARWVAPIVVNIKHPDLSGPGCPCFNMPTTLPLGKTGAPGAFDLLDLNVDQQNGTVGASTLASWIQNGFDKYLPLGGYYSDPARSTTGTGRQRARRPRRHRAPLPGLRHARGHRLECQLPRDCVGRLPPPAGLVPAGLERPARRLLHQGRLEGPPARRRLRSEPTQPRRDHCRACQLVPAPYVDQPRNKESSHEDDLSHS